MHNDQIRTVSAAKEIILAAGVFHTPKLLELSDVGSEQRLIDLGIPLVLDQPSVGENLQIHTMSVLPVPLASLPEADSIKPDMETLAFTHIDPEDQRKVLATYTESTD